MCVCALCIVFGSIRLRPVKISINKESKSSAFYERTNVYPDYVRWLIGFFFLFAPVDDDDDDCMKDEEEEEATRTYLFHSLFFFFSFCSLFYWRKFNRPDIGGHACGRTRSVQCCFNIVFFSLLLLFVFVIWSLLMNDRTKERQLTEQKNIYLYMYFWWHRPGTSSVWQNSFFLSLYSCVLKNFISRQCAKKAKLKKKNNKIVILPPADTIHSSIVMQVRKQNGWTNLLLTYWWYLYELETFQSAISYLVNFAVYKQRNNKNDFFFNFWQNGVFCSRFIHTKINCSITAICTIYM